MCAQLLLQSSSSGGRRLLLTVASAAVERTGNSRGLFMRPSNISYCYSNDVCRRDDLQIFYQRRLKGHSATNVSNLCYINFIIRTISPQIFRYKMVYPKVIIYQCKTLLFSKILDFKREEGYRGQWRSESQRRRRKILKLKCCYCCRRRQAKDATPNPGRHQTLSIFLKFFFVFRPFLLQYIKVAFKFYFFVF